MAEKTDASKLSDLVLGHLSPEESLHVIESLEGDPAGSAHVETSIRFMNVAAEHGDVLFSRVQCGGGNRGQVMEKLRGWVTGVVRSPHIAIPAAVVLFLFLLGAFVYGVRAYLTPPYAELAMVDAIEFRVAVRGPAEADLELAYRLYQAGDYRSSIRLLERYLKAYPSNPLTDYVRYSAGAVCLESAQGQLLGIVPRFDSSLVRKGMGHLRAAASSPSNPRLIEESRWLLAKGYLMLGLSGDALSELNLVVELGGPRQAEASHLSDQVKSKAEGGAR